MKTQNQVRITNENASLTGKRVKKEEPKTYNRLCHVFVLGSYWLITVILIQDQENVFFNTSSKILFFNLYEKTAE